MFIEAIIIVCELIKQTKLSYCICFSELVGKSSLEVRDFLLHFRTQVLPDGVYKIEEKGDELLLISKDVDLMASTVFAIIDLGTPVRVGVHYGQICYDEGRCFGSDINITSRLQTSSLPGNVIRENEMFFQRSWNTCFCGKSKQKLLCLDHPDDAARLKGNVYYSNRR